MTVGAFGCRPAFAGFVAFMRGQQIGFHHHIAAYSLGIAARDVNMLILIPFEALIGGDFDMAVAVATMSLARPVPELLSRGPRPARAGLPARRTRQIK